MLGECYRRISLPLSCTYIGMTAGMNLPAESKANGGLKTGLTEMSGNLPELFNIGHLPAQVTRSDLSAAPMGHAAEIPKGNR